MQCFKPLLTWIKPTDKSFEEECLGLHNWYRAKHGCPPLHLNKMLKQNATKWARELVAKNKLEHSSCHNYGENIYMADGLVVNGTMPVKAWYDEINEYNFFMAEFSLATGHFTQLIWKSTEKLGIGVATEGDMTIVVAHYAPPGNIIGKFRQNVPMRINKLDTEEPDTTRLPAALRARHIVFSQPDKHFHLECLLAHNWYRAMHQCPPLELSNELSAFATNWAQILAKRNIMQHSTGHNLGENIYKAEGARVYGYMPVKAWYQEIKDYDFDAAEFTPEAGHFTQAIWKSTKQLGVGVARHERVTVVVASYSPFGNVRGKFRENVPQIKPDHNTSDESIKSVSNVIKSVVRKPENHQKALVEYEHSTDNLQLVRPKEFTKIEKDFQQACLKAHNKYRAMHNCPSLRLNDSLSTYASNWAQELMALDELQQSATEEFGENVYMSIGLPVNGEVPVKVWYSGIETYNFEKAKFVPTAGGFTQVIWKSTEELGVGVFTSHGKTYVVCAYRPPGNVVGKFKENVPNKIVLDDTAAHHAEKL